MKAVIERRNAVERQMQIVLNNTNLIEYDKLLSCASDFFTEFEEYLFRNSDGNRNLSTLQANDILNSIENVFDFLLVYNEAIKSLAKKLNQRFSFSQNFLSTTQSIYKKYRIEKSIEYKKNFESSGIPITGFLLRKKLPLQTKTNDFLSVIVGFIFLCVCFVIAYKLKINSSMQYLFTRGLFSSGISLLLSGLGKGMIEVKLKVSHYKIAAIGTVALFIVTFFINPARPPEYKPNSELEQLNR